jgi:cyclophilin family peptidyl-prolyl cis-trans isomerase
MKNIAFKVFSALLVFVVCLTGLAATACKSSASSTIIHTEKWAAAPAMQIDKTKTYTAVFDTSLGSFKVELFASTAPITVNNFVFLAEQKFYDGTIFHRIIKTFMIQGGDPTGTGRGGPGYTIPDEIPAEHSNYTYTPGIVAMANTGRANTGGSQFFICTVDDSASLTPSYTQFGKIIEGMDVVQKIASVPVVAANNETSKPVNPPVIKTITIQES